MHSLRKLLCLSHLIGGAVGSVLPIAPEARSVQAGTTVNGTCISAPDTSCVSLVGICVQRIATGQVGSASFWTDKVCVAAATCATMASVLDAACCAGTCKRPTNIGSLDVNTVYRSMVGSACTAQPQDCALTWQPFVNWFYGTIQDTGTNIWPISGDDILDRWQDIATWTGFCKGDRCVDGAIPYSNFNDWFHYSSAVVATAPGTPQYVPHFSTLEENMDNWTPNILWPCLMDDPTDCWWDYGPPPPGTVQPEDSALAQVQRFPSESPTARWAKFTARFSGQAHDGPFRFGLAEHQPPNLPPPVYVNKTLFPLVLNGAMVHSLSRHNNSGHSFSSRSVSAPVLDSEDSSSSSSSLIVNASSRRLTGRASVITVAECETSTDTPTTLPTLTYYCPFFPNICANIRSHPDWDKSIDWMVLTYDPWDKGKRRNGVCTSAVKARYRAEGECDLRQHDANYWKVSCDEFPFSASLQGGKGNSITTAATNAEQDLQGTLQSSLTYLRMVENNGKTSWNTGKYCHDYKLLLVDTVPSGAPVNAIGSLDAGSQFFAPKPTATAIVTFRYVTNKDVLKPVPPTFSVDTPYQASETAITVPKLRVKSNCAPCPAPVTTPPAAPDLQSGVLNVVSPGDPSAVQAVDPIPISPPTSATEELVKRQASSCSARPPASPVAPLPTSSAGALSVAAASASSARAAAAAASAALASAINPSAPEAAAAAAAISAANVLGPAADALASAATDASLASAIAASEAAVIAAQSAATHIFSLGPSISSWLSEVLHHVSSSTANVSHAIDASSNIIKPTTPVPPDVDPSRSPILNLGPPASAPPAACFGAGSEGFLKLGNSYFTNDDGNAPATLVHVGSNAFFGLQIPTNRALAPVDGCNSVYAWFDIDLQADFQVNCATMELGSFWNGVKQECYSYSEAATPNLFSVLCGNSISNVYACLQQWGMYGNLLPAFINWARS